MVARLLIAPDPLWIRRCISSPQASLESFAMCAVDEGSWKPSVAARAWCLPVLASPFESLQPCPSAANVISLRREVPGENGMTMPSGRRRSSNCLSANRASMPSSFQSWSTDSSVNLNPGTQRTFGITSLTCWSPPSGRRASASTGRSPQTVALVMCPLAAPKISLIRRLLTTLSQWPPVQWAEQPESGVATIVFSPGTGQWFTSVGTVWHAEALHTMPRKPRRRRFRCHPRRRG